MRHQKSWYACLTPLRVYFSFYLKCSTLTHSCTGNVQSEASYLFLLETPLEVLNVLCFCLSIIVCMELRDLLEISHLSTFDLLSLYSLLILLSLEKGKSDQILDTFLCMCPIVFHFITATLYLSLAFIVSLSHINSSPTTAIQISS